MIASVEQRGRARPPVILIVAMPNSIHAVRWINMVRGSWARIVLIPAYQDEPSGELFDWVPIRTMTDLEQMPDDSVGVFDLSILDREESWAADAANGYTRLAPTHSALHRGYATPDDVVRAVEILKPDLLHSLEVQLAGYITSEAKRRLGRRCPPWLLSNWGSDIYLYERAPQHREVLVDVIRRMDGYIAECGRDVALVRELGFAGVSFNPIPASGGQDFSSVPRLDELPPPSKRDLIMVKGYHGWAGRGLHILSAIHLAAPALKRFRLRVIFATPAIQAMTAAIRRADGLDIECEPYLGTHEAALARLGQARMVVSMGISDGISTTLLEAMSLGVFPIQSDTSCACEWVRNGQDGIVLGPHDVAGVADALVRVAEDDDLVDAAAIRNRAVVEQRWNSGVNGATARSYYQAMLGGAWAIQPELRA